MTDSKLAIIDSTQVSNRMFELAYVTVSTVTLAVVACGDKAGLPYPLILLSSGTWLIVNLFSIYAFRARKIPIAVPLLSLVCFSGTFVVAACIISAAVSVLQPALVDTPVEILNLFSYGVLSALLVAQAVHALRHGDSSTRAVPLLFKTVDFSWARRRISAALIDSIFCAAGAIIFSAGCSFIFSLLHIETSWRFLELALFTGLIPIVGATWLLAMCTTFFISSLMLGTNTFNPNTFVNLAAVVGSLLFLARMESSASMASPGKLFMGLRVRDSNGKRLSFRKAVSRNLCKFIPSGMFVMVGYLPALFGPKQTLLHDIVCKTQVDRIPDETEVRSFDESLTENPEEQIEILIAAGKLQEADRLSQIYLEKAEKLHLDSASREYETIEAMADRLSIRSKDSEQS